MYLQYILYILGIRTRDDAAEALWATSYPYETARSSHVLYTVSCQPQTFHKLCCKKIFVKAQQNSEICGPRKGQIEIEYRDVKQNLFESWDLIFDAFSKGFGFFHDHFLKGSELNAVSESKLLDSSSEWRTETQFQN